MDLRRLGPTLQRQAGVIARRQVLEAGGSDQDIARWLARRECARVFEGVYVDHTGPLTWPQRAWSAVVVHAPAALAGRSALIPIGPSVPGRRVPPLTLVAPDVIEVVVARTRRVVDPPGVRTTRIADFDDQVLANLSPPRVRPEHAVLSVASRAAGVDSVVAALGDACQSGRTTPARLIASATDRTRLPQRRLILEVLHDVEAGTNSALERRYLRDVERPHGLPRGIRQPRVVMDGRVRYHDVDYRPYRTLVELDGRLGHSTTTDRWQDLDRDVQALVQDQATLRAGWLQILRPCRLAVAVASVLRQRGWAEELRRCGASCLIP